MGSILGAILFKIFVNDLNGRTAFVLIKPAENVRLGGERHWKEEPLYGDTSMGWKIGLARIL